MDEKPGLHAIPAVAAACKAAGNPSRLAKALTAAGEKTSHQAVFQWLSGDCRISPSRAKLIERLFGIPKYRFRPDLWDRTKAA